MDWMREVHTRAVVVQEGQQVGGEWAQNKTGQTHVRDLPTKMNDSVPILPTSTDHLCFSLLSLGDSGLRGMCPLCTVPVILGISQVTLWIQQRDIGLHGL